MRPRDTPTDAHQGLQAEEWPFAGTLPPRPSSCDSRPRGGAGDRAHRKLLAGAAEPGPEKPHGGGDGPGAGPGAACKPAGLSGSSQVSALSLSFTHSCSPAAGHGVRGGGGGGPLLPAPAARGREGQGPVCHRRLGLRAGGCREPGPMGPWPRPGQAAALGLPSSERAALRLVRTSRGLGRRGATSLSPATGGPLRGLRPAHPYKHGAGPPRPEPGQLTHGAWASRMFRGPSMGPAPGLDGSSPSGPPAHLCPGSCPHQGDPRRPPSAPTPTRTGPAALWPAGRGQPVQGPSAQGLLAGAMAQQACAGG